ncbi:MAG: hypothetical protein IT210_02635, partial [Armatimonadetes bacterium]|nr:hypothetical protein [Armatimonadota bacterium]
SDWAISFYQARKVELGSVGNLAVQIDGEEVDLTTPIIAEAVPGTLRVRVPVREKV